MKTAIITGASSGLGLEFVRRLRYNFPEVESVWLIARRREKLEELRPMLQGLRVEIMPLDLCSRDSFGVLEEKLRRLAPRVSLLINNAGCGYLGNVDELSVEKELRMTDLNITALTAVTSLVLPYMTAGGHIINVSSIASFCPNPRMTVYSASKAYVSAFSRSLGEELRGRGISVTAVCPGPMGTEFLDIGGIKGRSKTFDRLPYCQPGSVAAGACAAAAKGRAVYTPGAFYKFYRFAAKIMPQSLMIKAAKT